MARYNKYPQEQEAFIRANAFGISRKELTERFNKQFGTNKTVHNVRTWCNHRKIHSGFDGRFEDGHTSWQTGLKGDDYKSHFTDESFKQSIRGISDKRKHSVGDTVIRHGAPYVVKATDKKVSWDKRIQPKCRYVWENENGKIPDGYMIINIDGDLTNCDLSNLYCISPQTRMIMNSNKWLSAIPEIKLAAIKWCELFGEIKQVRTPSRQYAKQEV